MLYYRYWIEKDFRNSIHETDKVIGFDICQNTWIEHTNKSVAWFPKSQMIIEETDTQIDFLIPEWLFKKNHRKYRDFDGINMYRNYVEER